MKTIAAVFDTADQAKEAYRALQSAGVPGDNIGLVKRKEPADEVREEVRVEHEAPVAGAALGAVLGGAAGWWAAVIGVTAIAVPVVGPIIAAGAAAGVAMIAGGAVGWLVGGLTAAGMPEDEARFYQAEVERGGIVLTVSVHDDQVDAVRAVLDRSGGRRYVAA